MTTQNTDDDTYIKTVAELIGEKLRSREAARAVAEIAAQRDQLQADNTRLLGEAGVMRQLLKEATLVMATIEWESDDEQHRLYLLQASIQQALRGAP